MGLTAMLCAVVLLPRVQFLRSNPRATDRHEQVSLAELPLSDYQEAHPDLDDGVYEVLGTDKAIDAFVSYGSTASVEVAKQIERWKTKLKATE